MESQIDISSARLENIVIHRVGNKSRDEGLKLSERVVESSDQLDELLLRHYLQALVRDAEERDFFHESDLTLNAVLKFASVAFHDQQRFLEQSTNIAKHLYSVSVHPNVLAGELLVMALSGIYFCGQPCKALGIVKTEVKDDYIDILEEHDALQAIERSGIPLNRVQKGALILNVGNRVYTIDALNQKTKYWLDDFLKVVPADSAALRARMGGLVLKSIAKSLTDTVERIDLGRKLKTAIEDSEALTVAELRELSEAYLGTAGVSDIFTGVRERSGVELEDDVEIDSRSLERYARELTRRIPVGDGVSIVISGRSTEVADVSVTRTRAGFRISAEFTVGEDK